MNVKNLKICYSFHRLFSRSAGGLFAKKVSRKPRTYQSNAKTLKSILKPKATPAEIVPSKLFFIPRGRTPKITAIEEDDFEDFDDFEPHAPSLPEISNQLTEFDLPNLLNDVAEITIIGEKPQAPIDENLICRVCNVHFVTKAKAVAHNKTKSHIETVHGQTTKFKIQELDIKVKDHADLIGGRWIVNTLIQGYLTCRLAATSTLILESEQCSNLLNRAGDFSLALQSLYNSDILEYEFVVGVELVNTNHWVAVFIDIDKSTLSIVDPYGHDHYSHQSDFYTSRLANLQQFFKRIDSCKKWSLRECPHDFQNQTDSYNCGVFCAIYIEDLVLKGGITPEFKNLSHYRKQMSSVLSKWNNDGN